MTRRRAPVVGAARRVLAPHCRRVSAPSCGAGRMTLAHNRIRGMCSPHAVSMSGKVRAGHTRHCCLATCTPRARRPIVRPALPAAILHADRVVPLKLWSAGSAACERGHPAPLVWPSRNCDGASAADWCSAQVCRAVRHAAFGLVWHTGRKMPRVAVGIECACDLGDASSGEYTSQRLPGGDPRHPAPSTRYAANKGCKEKKAHGSGRKRIVPNAAPWSRKQTPSHRPVHEIFAGDRMVFPLKKASSNQSSVRHRLQAARPHASS